MGRNIYNLKVGDKIQIGKTYAKKYRQFKAGEVITLIEGYFEYDNGLYTDNITTPSIWNEEEKEFDSIYHLFGNNMEQFLDCKLMAGHNVF